MMNGRSKIRAPGPSLPLIDGMFERLLGLFKGSAAR